MSKNMRFFCVFLMFVALVGAGLIAAHFGIRPTLPEVMYISATMVVITSVLNWARAGK